MFTLGEPIPAKTCVEWGLAHVCVPRAKLRETALALAKKLADKPLGSLCATKRLMREPEAGEGRRRARARRVRGAAAIEGSRRSVQGVRGEAAAGFPQGRAEMRGSIAAGSAMRGHVDAAGRIEADAVAQRAHRDAELRAQHVCGCRCNWPASAARARARYPRRWSPPAARRTPRPARPLSMYGKFVMGHASPPINALFHVDWNRIIEKTAPTQEGGWAGYG